MDPERVLAASERVAAYLRQAILRGTIKPGERIRQEDIAARLGASRLPVREALRMLELEGLTENLVNRGARVPLLDMHQVDMLYRMREQLEPLALPRACGWCQARTSGGSRTSTIASRRPTTSKRSSNWTANSIC